MENMERDSFLKKILNSYAVILVSLGDISPHMILDAISLNKPFILTKENGLMDRIGSVAITVDPKNEEEIAEKILWLLNEENYNLQVEKIKNFSFTRTWEDIAKEYLDIFDKI
jgi:glycosyltransferase involved in cell wall biosynthesis